MSRLMQTIEDRVVLLDGGFGTQIFLKTPSADDFGGQGHEGCVDFLSERRPEWIKEIHAAYLDAGSDAVETNTFGANPLVLSEFGLEGKAEGLNTLSAKLARDVASSYAVPRFVIGSVGPGTKLVTLGHVGHGTLFQSYLVQMRGLIKGGVDAILIETCQDLGQMKIAVRAAKAAMAELRATVPIWAQATIETSGNLLVGSDLHSVLVSLEAMGIDALGMNCGTGPDEMSRHLGLLAEQSPLPISCLPNAGLPVNKNGELVYPMAPETFAEKVEGMAKRFGVSIVGGCCGTTPSHIRALKPKIESLSAPRRHPRLERHTASLYHAVSMHQEPRPLIIGERTNANGSKKFRDLLARDDWDGLIGVAKEQQREGAHILDVCVAYVGRCETDDMGQFLARLVTQITMPLMIDSTDAGAIEKALEVAPGKCIVNSINLEEGEAKARQILALCKRYGASVLALTIDEQGMAKTMERKAAIAERLYGLVVGECKFHPSDLIIDPLTFTLASGDDEYRGSALATLEAIKAIKERCPDALTSLGVSNVSFGLSPAARLLLNALMLYHAVQAGLDMAIFNASKVTPVSRIDAGARDLFEDLIFDRRRPDYDPLKLIVTEYADKKATEARAPHGRRSDMDIEERLRQDIIDGERGLIADDIDLAIEKNIDPLHLINDVLLSGMQTVGERFGAGEMQLPFVLESAEAMKVAVARLEPHMPKGLHKTKGRLLLATVKGDVHDIGKNLVEIIMSNNGFEVENLGIKQPIEDILGAYQARPADAIGLSGLLVKSTVAMKEYLGHMHRLGHRVPVILGGAALTKDYVETACREEYQCDAVYYAADAFDGLRHMEDIMSSAAGATRAGAGAALGTALGTALDAALDAALDTALDTALGTGKAEGHEDDKPRRDLTEEGQSSWVSRECAPPVPHFWGAAELAPPIEEALALMGNASVLQSRWAFKKGRMSDDQYQAVMHEKAGPLLDYWKTRIVAEKLLAPKAAYGYFPAVAHGDSLDVYDTKRSEILAAFAFPRQASGRRLAISDFFCPASKGFDVLALQLVTLGPEIQAAIANLYAENRYSDYFYLHGLAAELTECCAKWLHARIRGELKIASGQRFSFGYPACPDLGGNAAILKLLGGVELGVSLTETMQLVPEFTTCAMVAWHPQAAHFGV
jgi:5-methyltetrahydrofolate--homocysteine methyltransferase